MSPPDLPPATSFPEVSPSSQWCQRWTGRRHSWRHTSEGGFDPERYLVEPISEAAARSWVVAHHYSGSYPAASRRYALIDRDRNLLGVCVLGIPMSAAVLTNVFPDLEPMVESWFLARVFADAAAAGVRGVVAFADPVPRRVAGRLLFPGHRGVIYMASNAAYLGRGTARTLTLLRDGRVLSARSAQKVRRQERGHAHVESQLVSLGASRRRPGQAGAAWLTDALNDVGATRLRHRGNHRYAFPLSPTARQRARIRIGLPAGHYPSSIDAVDGDQLDLFAAPQHESMA